MFRNLVCFLAAVLVTVSALPALDTADQLVRLDTHLEKIRKEYEFNRLLGGSSLTGTGILIGGAGTAAAFYLTNGNSSDTVRVRNAVIGLSWVYGGLFIVPGVLVLALKSDYESMPEQYAKTASATDEEVRLKVVRGEVTLQSLADKARFERLLLAGTIGLGGAAMMYLSTQASPYYSGTASGSSLTTNPNFVTGVLYLGVGVLRALLESTPENENRAYRRWRLAE